MQLSLEVRRARKGDCLLLHYGTQAVPGLLLIDGGPSQVYPRHLKPRLAQLREVRQPPDGDSPPNDRPLVVDLLMVSHIDDDHIKGVLELTAELVALNDEQRPPSVRVSSLWHNSFDDIIGNSPKELLTSVTAVFGAASLTGGADAEGLNLDTAMVLASVPQGLRLRDDARRLKISVNKETDGKLIMATGGTSPIDIGKGLTLTVVGPMQAELLKLQAEYDAFLRTARKKATTALAGFTDNTPANLSSIVVLAEAGTKKVLLTGDARGDKILEGLELVDLLKKGKTLHVDILKVPHHGSDRNVAPVFFRRITADHYVFSGNGEHGNPERTTLQMLLDERGNAEYAVHLTYPIKEIDEARREDWSKEQAKERARQKKDASVLVRGDWSPARHSLSALLKAHPDFARKVQVVDETQAHMIDLLDHLPP